jgi:hypothetical protein
MSTFAEILKAEHAAFLNKQKRQSRARRTENSPLRNEDFYYTDSSKYADQYSANISKPSPLPPCNATPAATTSVFA